jgi:glycosidase
VDKAFHEEETWTEGLARLYYILAQDFLYDNPYSNVIFPDNHDLDRYFTVMGEDMDKFKMGLVYYYTTRGIPVIYYGTEILMTGLEHDGHGYIREDFPGGWKGDTVNAFRGKGLRKEQMEAQAFVKHLQNWRKTSEAVHSGNLLHYIPADGVYVYFRIAENDTIMVVMNNNRNAAAMPELKRFDESLGGKRRAYEVTGQNHFADISSILIPAKTALIFEIE